MAFRVYERTEDGRKRQAAPRCRQTLHDRRAGNDTLCRPRPARRWRHPHASPRFLAACAAALALVAGAPAASAQTVLTMSSWVPPTHSLTRDVLGAWAKQVEKATNGRVKFEMLPKHPSAPPGTFDAVRDGLVDVSFVTASYTPARHPLPLMAELPGAGATAEINSVAFSRIHWKYFQAANEYKGVKLLGVFTHGPGQMFLVKKPVTVGRRSRRHEDPHRRRHLRGLGQGARRIAAASSRRPSRTSCSRRASPTAPSSRPNRSSPSSSTRSSSTRPSSPAASIPRRSASS